MQPWFKNVKPHKDIQDGHLDESIFAANLAEVAAGNGREIYRSPEMFFSKTFFTAGLKNIAKRVVQGLNGGQDADNRVISLQTGFGGGKTHTLISLFHLAKWGKKAASSEFTKELLATTGEPRFESANIAVFTNTTNDPAQGRKVDGITIRTLWGELAFQLGGKEAYEIIKANDEKLVAPKGLFKTVLEKCKPALILIDELADYCVSASAIKVEASNLSDQTVSFVQELTEAVSGTDNCVLIATLPASAQELAASPVSAQILTALENRITRVGANMKPVEDEEIFEVVRRRLFEDLGNDDEIDKVVSSYAMMYQALLTEIPSYALKSDYRERLKKSYPFHPELIDMFRLRWASNPYFQRTRGVLRILAAVVSDLWKRQTSLTGSQYLIHTSDVTLSNVEAITNQITILNGTGWDSVINADVSGTSSNAFRIDNEVKELGKNSLTQGIAATILLGTFGSKGQNKGVGIDELKLCMVKPESFNHNDINGALDRMERIAHYLYFSTSGQKRYWFDTTPNINILINQAKGEIDKNKDDVFAEIVKRIKEKTKSIQLFTTLVDPLDEIPEQTKPTLIILSPKYLANPSEVNGKTKPVIEKIATKKGNSERIYRNTILFLICSEIGIGKLQDDIKNYLACQKISSDYNTQLNTEQKIDIGKRIKNASDQIDTSLVSAYSILAKYSVKNGVERLIIKQFKDGLDNQINSNVVAALKEEEWLLESVGLGTLKSNNLLPTKEQAIKAKDVYEAFLRFDDKPMITGQDAVSKSILRYCMNGEYCIATGDGTTFTKFFFQENVPFFEVTDVTYWLVDKSLKPIPQPTYITPINGNGEDSTPKQELNDSGIPAAPSGTSGNTDTVTVKKFKSITVSGKVPLERYTELFNYFITPFAMSGNKIEIEVKFKIKSNEVSPIDESKQQYKSAKEASKQLGLNFEEEV
jgi:predicted AAA+ superfamily ATPase